MKKVTAVEKDGSFTMFESLFKLHDVMVFDKFEDLLKTLPKEKLNGGLIEYWNNAGLITKYLSTMFYLSVINEGEMFNSTVCIIPKDISQDQMDYYEEI